MGITFQLQKDPKDNRINPIRRFGNWLLDSIVPTKKEEIALKSISLFKENPSATNLEPVVNLLSNSQKNIRLAASEALATFYFNSKNKTSYISLCEHPDPYVREGVLNALSKIEVPVHSDYDVLSKLFTDKNESVKRRAWSIFTERILKGISDGDESISIEVLTRLLEHKDPIIANAVQLTVQRLGGKFNV